MINDACGIEDSGSLEEEHTKRASGSHLLFKEDNTDVYCRLEEATRSMVHSASIKTFQRKKDSRNSSMSIAKQYTGVDEWKCQLQKSEDCINSKNLKGNINYPLADHVSKHRKSYVPIVQLSINLDYQLPNDLARVRKLIRSIESFDPKLLATIATVETDEVLKSDVEAMTAYILPCDPATNNKDDSNKNEKCSVSDAGVVPMVGGRYQ